MSKKQTKDQVEPDQPQPEAAEQAPTDDDQTQQLVERLSEDLKRAQADFVNLKRRTQQEQAERSKRIKADIVRNILPVLDSLERAVAHRPQDLKGNDWANGVDAVLKQLYKALNDYGVSKVETVGQQFDPNLHEAISIDDGDGDDEVVVEELQSGYQLDDYVIRHAMVKVARK